MLRIIHSPAFQRQLLACGISTSRTLLIALQTVKPPLTSLNGAAMTAKLDLEGTLEEVASTHFSESSAFPEFSLMEDTLLSEAVPRIKTKPSTMASLNGAAANAHFDLNGTLEEVASSRFSESSAFPEFSPMEDTLLSEAVPRIKTRTSSMASLNRAVKNAQLNFEGTLEEVASSHFSESSAFPEFSPMEDTLLSEAVPLIKHNTTMASLNRAARNAQLELDGTLEEVASSHFSESSAFPEFSPMEDTLLSETVSRIKSKVPVIDAHSLAQEELNEEMQHHFCASSDFLEYSAAEEEAMMHKE